MSVGKLLRKGLPFNNVSAVAGSIATAMIQPGRTIEGLELNMAGTGLSLASISLVRLRANGKVFYEATGTQIDKINRFQGLSYTAASATAVFLPIMFTELKGRDLLDEMMGAFDTSNGIANVSIEVTIGTATTVTALELYLIESAPQAGVIAPAMTKVLRYPYSVSAGGQLSIPLPFGPVNGSVIKRNHVEHATVNNVTGMTIKENGVVVHESVKVFNDGHNVLFGKTNQQAATPYWYSVDLMADCNVKNAMDTRTDRSLELVPTFGAADSGFVLVEYLDTLGNL